MLERTCRVPDLLWRLMEFGIVPKWAMSWFNPMSWGRYRGQDIPDWAKSPGPEFATTPASTTTTQPEGTGKSSGATKIWWPDMPTNTAAAADDADDDTGSKKDSDAMSPDDVYAWNYIGGCVRVGFGFFPWETPTYFPAPSTTPGPPNLPVIPGTTPATTSLWNINDVGANAVQNFIGTFDYWSADLEFGLGCLRSNYHQGPELQPQFQSTAATYPWPAVAPAPIQLRNQTPTLERYITEGWADIKFNNGQFGFNTELDWFNRVYRFQKSLNGTFFGLADHVDGSGSLFASKYSESWRYMAEAWGVYGSYAVRAFYCFTPGPDRRHGVYIDRQPFVQELPQQAFGLFDPYSMLLAYRFGSGVNAPGHISDASVFAVKLDYYLACNLILEGSALYAIRNSHGYAIGYVKPDTSASAGHYGNVVYTEPAGSTFTAPAPSIPERGLGWEFMGSFTWKILEGWAVGGRVAYWQPGKWFNYACIDKSVPKWDMPSAANYWGVKPDRVIDPVLGFEITLGATY